MFMQLQERLTVLDPLSGFFKNAFFLLRAVAANILVGWYGGLGVNLRRRR